MQMSAVALVSQVGEDKMKLDVLQAKTKKNAM